MARRSAELYVLSRLSQPTVSEEHSSTIERLKKVYNIDDTIPNVGENVARKINGNSRKIYLVRLNSYVQEAHCIL